MSESPELLYWAKTDTHLVGLKVADCQTLIEVLERAIPDDEAASPSHPADSL